MQVVVVESPAKAKTINKYLGPGFKVLASYGHVRDLPSKDGSVKPDEDFAMVWDTEARGAARIKEIADAVKGSDKLILATDPDREGEAISWHVLEALQAKRVLKGVDVRRVVFNAITKSAVTEAMKRPRSIDLPLVEAYLARRALDYLVGFTLSPVLWRKLPGARSAGRVQSVALRLICERETEIEAFKPQEYWTVAAQMRTAEGQAFEARLAELDGKKLTKFSLGNKTAADAALAAVKAGQFTVEATEAKPVKRYPPPPFITSTLQQEAARKLGFSAQRTMQAAQKLYEGISIGGETTGLITYMRTDGVQMAEEGLLGARAAIRADYGDRYLPDKPRHYATKAKNAQEAHEAIRPTDFRRRPQDMHLEGDLGRLYELIWKRAVASQMEPAELERTTVDLNDTVAGRTVLRATGQVVLFDGFLRLYQEGRDDDADGEDGARLPKLARGDRPSLLKADSSQHFTEPPPRYSEASLVKKLEELGIGRPSTYASILSTLSDRGYVRTEKNRFFPEDKGRLVTAFLENFFRRYVEYDFTAELESRLDKVSAGELGWKELLREFWQAFRANTSEVTELRVSDVLTALNEALAPRLFPVPADAAPDHDPRACPSCADGALSLKLGKFGAFIGCSNYPTCRYTRPFGTEEAAQQGAIPADGTPLGPDPDSGMMVTLRSGRFGPYVQLGEGEKPKRTSLPDKWRAEELTLKQALQLLSLPREVGVHPEDGKPIVANLGRYGPYVQHDKTYANLSGVDEVFEVGLNRAITLIAEKRSGARFKKGGAVAALVELGEHPDGGPVQVFSGRYGPYVKHGDVNATLPKGADPQAVTLDQALALIAERAAVGGSKPKAKGRAGAKSAAKSGAKTASKAGTKAAAKPAAKPATKRPSPKRAAATDSPA